MGTSLIISLFHLPCIHFSVVLTYPKGCDCLLVYYLSLETSFVFFIMEVRLPRKAAWNLFPGPWYILMENDTNNRGEVTV